MTNPFLKNPPTRRYPDGMAEDTRPSEDMTAALAGVGIIVTPEGKARARKLLADADARRDPGRREALRARFAMPPHSS
jgi:hypothetical protein